LRRVDWRRRLVTLAVTPLLLWISVARPASAQDSAASKVRNLISNAQLSWARWPDFSRYVDDLNRLYASQHWAALWIERSRLSRSARAAILQLAAADEHGLDPRDYDAGTLDSLARRLSSRTLQPADQTRFDLLLTVSLMRYVDDLRSGRLHPKPLSRSIPILRSDLAADLAGAISGDSVARLVVAAAPQFAQYRKLQQALARYRALAADTSLQSKLPIVLVRPGQTYSGLGALRRRLATLGDLPADSATFGGDDRYSGAVVDAVRRFQARHSLPADGMLGPTTFAELNVPLTTRVRQIQLALERLRWLPPIRHQPFLVVNVPAFELFGFDSAGGVGAPSLRMKAIVGKALGTLTPVLAEQLRYAVFRPYWNVPRSILLAEILPQVRRNPNYLRSHDMELVGSGDRVLREGATPEILRQLVTGEVRLRQRPSSHNPMGPVKFVFPNAADVYLHGTPDVHLFARARRDFSHGCIRVEHPLDLAEWVLRDQSEWTRARIEAAAEASGSSRVLLSRPMPVILFYTTAVITPEGAVVFYHDIYGHDFRLDQALRAGPMAA
jgi:murein L,D-transpeptidase YcbB/YkuD